MRRRATGSTILVLALTACSPSLPPQKAFEPPRPAPPGAGLAFSGAILAPGADSCGRDTEMADRANAAFREELLRAGYTLNQDGNVPRLGLRIDRLGLSPCSQLGAYFLATHARVSLSVTLKAENGILLYQRTLEGADDIPAGVSDAPRLATGNAAADALHFVLRDAAFTAAMANFAKAQ